MYFDALTAAAVADELSATILGGFVQRVVLSSQDSIALEIYSHRQRYQLLLTTEPTHSRALLVSSKPTAQPGLVTPFGLLLRKHVLDGTVTQVDQPAGERIIAMSISKRHEGHNATVWLHAELMGRHSNLMLLDVERATILESIKRVTPDMSSVRPILPKKPFTPPPARAGLAPHRVAPDELQRLAAEAKASAPLTQTLVSGVSGLSPLAAREIVFRAGGSPEAKTGEWTDWTPLALEVRRLAALWATREWRPCAAKTEAGTIAYAPYELRHLAGSADLVHYDSMSQAIEQYTGATPQIVSHGQLREQILTALDRRAETMRKRLESLRREEATSEDAGRLMEDGQLVLAYSYSIEPGQTELALEDRTIKLDPDLTPAENAQRMFDSYKRRRRAGEDLPALIEQAQRELEQLEEYRTFSQLASGHVELSQLRAEAVAAGVIQGPSGQGQGTRKPPPAKTASLTAPDGTKILVGKSAAQNARVLEAGSPDDWWFHAREIPGAHVVARTGGAEPVPDTLRRAAETAAYYSSARDSGSVEVVYAPLRYVRKIKGAGPGQVTYRNERSIRVEPRDHLDGE